MERGGRLMIIVSLFIEKIAQDTSVDSKKQDWSNPLLPNFKWFLWIDSTGLKDMETWQVDSTKIWVEKIFHKYNIIWGEIGTY